MLLRLPEELGPVEVRISVRESDATVTFVAPHADARAALEQAMPRLREMLAAQGLALADSAVFADSQRQSGSQQTPQYTPSPTPTSLDQHARSERGVAETDSRDPLNRPLLDLYA